MRLDSSMLDNILKKLIGSKNDRELKRLWARVQAINALEPGIQALSDAELKAKTPYLKNLLANGASMEEGPAGGLRGGPGGVPPGPAHAPF